MFPFGICLTSQITQLRERNRELETEMSKVARVGKKEEVDFAEQARTWAGIYVSEKLPRNGDFILAYRDPSGAPLEPCMLVDNKRQVGHRRRRYPPLKPG